MTRNCFVAAALLLLVQVHAIPCWMIRKAVAQHGEKAVESWARSKGIPDKEIEEARLCLKR
jgi:hypothetical protein